MKKSWLRWLSLLGIAIYTILFSEWFVRIVSPQPLMPRYVTSAPWGVRRNIPNAHYWQETPDARVEFRINAQGMRDTRNFEFEKPPGTCHIQLHGDSFFMGYELNYLDTFAAKLEEGLRAVGWRVEVINLAVSGFGTAEMVQTYEGFGAQFDSDLVVYEWHSSDFQDNVRSQLFVLDDGELKRANATFLPSVALQDLLMRSALYRYVSDNSHLYSLVRERVAIAVKNLVLTLSNLARFGRAEVRADQENPRRSAQNELEFLADPYAVNLSAALLRRAKADASANGAGFLLVEIPFRLGKSDLRSSSTLLPPALWSEITLVSPIEAFKKEMQAHKLLYYLNGEGHLTPLGAQILTNAVLKRLKDDPHLSHCKHDTPSPM